MDESDFWRELAKEFRALPQDDSTYADQVIDGIPGSEPPPSDYWMLHSNSTHVAMQFEALARRGGDVLLPNDTSDSFQVWINALCSYGLYIDTKNIMQRLPGAGLLEVVLQVRKRIRRLPETSALFCGGKEIQTLLDKRTKKAPEAQENDPGNWPPPAEPQTVSDVPATPASMLTDSTSVESCEEPTAHHESHLTDDQQKAIAEAEPNSGSLRPLPAVRRDEAQMPKEDRNAKKPVKRSQKQKTIENPRSVERRSKRRSAWLDEKCGEKKWTSDLEIQNSGGPTYNTIQRYRSGKKSTHDPSVRLKLATVFVCKLDEVPK